jgi:ribosomal protein S18 acetylase RimI-like enzyme
MPQTTLRRATAQDAETLVRIQTAAFLYDSVMYPHIPPGGPDGYDSVEAVREEIEDYHAYVIEADGVPVGGAVVFVRPNGHNHLHRIYIDPEQHGYGIGTQAMRLLDEVLPAPYWTLDTPDWAIRNQHFYEKLGYVLTGETSPVDDWYLLAYQRGTPAENT